MVKEREATLKDILKYLLEGKVKGMEWNYTAKMY